MKRAEIFISFVFLLICSTVYGQTDIVPYHTPYQTSGQNLWQPGTTGIFEVENEFFGFDWNEGGTFGSITSIAGEEFGAEVTAGTWGEMGSGISINFGTEEVSIDYDAVMNIEHPSVDAFQAGDEIVINTDWHPNSTDSEIVPSTYDINASLWLDLGIGFNMSAELCAFGCTDFDIFDIDLDTERYNLVELSSQSGLSLLEGEIYQSDPIFPYSYSDPWGVMNLTLDLPSNTGPNSNTYIAGDNVLHYTNSSQYFDMYFSVPSFIAALNIPYVSAFFANLSNSWSSGPFYLNYTLMEAGFGLGLHNKQHLELTPEMHGKLDFPTKIDYRIVDASNGSVLESDYDSVINYMPGQNIRIDFPCNYDFMEVVPSFHMENEFRNHTYDSIAFDFIFEALTFNVGVESMTVIPEICIPIYKPCGPWYCPVCDWCYDGDLCTPAVVFPGYDAGFGPLVELQPNLFNISYDWVDNTWEMEGFNSFENQTPFILEPNKFTVDATGVDVLCYGESTGEATATVSNGRPPYTYHWSNGSSNFTHSTSHTVTGLSAGTHYVSVYDDNGCMEFAPVTINQPEHPVSIEADPQDLTCYNSDDGSINIITSGGTPPYSYNWSHGETSESADNLPVGDYSLTITDNNGCSLTESFTISQPEQLKLSFNTTDVDCMGSNTGSIESVVTGGITPYSYNWSNGETGSTIDSLYSGYYDLTVTDANGCTISDGVDIFEPEDPLTAVDSVSHVQCHGENSGSITLDINGGTSPYTCAWYSEEEDIWLNESSAVLSDIYAGNYTVIVTDAQDCDVELSIEVNEPPAFESEAIVTDVLCHGNSDGAIETILSGGTEPYSFAWSNGETTQNITDISAGTYTLTITDDNACTYILEAEVNQPDAPLTSEVSMQEVLCYGDSTGQISVETMGGTPPYTYEWSNGSSSANLTDMPAGTYTLTVTDANNCLHYTGGEIRQPDAPLTTEWTTTDASCFGYEDGLIEINAEGGTLPYTIQWDDDEYLINNELYSIQDIPAGNYNFVLVDDNDCKIYNTFSIAQPEAIDISFETGIVSCYGGSDGYVTSIIDGGTEPYTYSWSNGSNNQNLTDVTAGHYNFTLTDNQNCQQDTSVQVESFPEIITEYTVEPKSCRDKDDASIELSVSGGTGEYDYEWSSGQHTPNINNLASGSYGLTITDGNYCEKLLDILIPENNSECLYIPNSFTPNGDGYNDTWVIRNITAYPNALVQVYSQEGRLLMEANGGYTPWDGQYNGRDVPSGTYYYVVNLNNGDEPYKGSLSILR
ncbi:MAG: gliding motility-associated C-terminal domain-containing protein [Bacteroidales bacterium]